MKSFARVLEVALGIFFMVSAGAKAMNIEGFGVQISSYGVIKAPALVMSAAYATLTMETLIGASLASGRTLRGFTYFVAAGMTVVFTGLMFYAWQFKGLEDCGCFGDYVKLGPGPSILKNFVLLGLLAASWTGNRIRKEEAAMKLPMWRTALAVVGIIAVIAIGCTQNQPTSGNSQAADAATEPTSGPFSKYVFETDSGTIDLGKGDHLVTLLSATCTHCMDSVPFLNDLEAADDLPDVVALMLGEPSDIDDFKALTDPKFPLFGIPAIEFMQFIDTAPPRLAHVRDGQPMESWEWEDAGPTVEDVRKALSEEK